MKVYVPVIHQFHSRVLYLTVTLKETGATTTADNEGYFQFPDISLNLGDNSFTVETIDSAGNQNQEAISIARIQETNADLTLIENLHFTVKENQTLTIPSTPLYLTFSISNIAFDSTDTDFINDAFEVALVDNEGNSLVHTIGFGKSAFFNWTEGESVRLGAGAIYSATDKTVTLNLTGITPGIEANLVFRLVNDDSDTTTGVSLKNIAIIDAPDDTQPPVQTRFDSNTLATPLSATEFSKLSDISSSFKPEYHNTSFNADTDTLFADIAIRNIGGYGVDSPLLVAIANISDPTVVLRNPDGITPEGIPYYNFSDLVIDGKLDPNEVTNTGSLEFYNPNGGQFSYELIVLGQLNQNPIIETKPLLEIISGQVYQYNVDATDVNGDSLIYKPVIVPDGATIDPDTGLISWDTTAAAVGNYTIKIEVSDNRGGLAEQTFTLSVIEPPPNRPPVITSIPVVDANVNTPYIYGAIATDYDRDKLTFSKVSGPDGMTVDPDTGIVTWKPTGDQLGTHEIVLKVDDGRGGYSAG